MIEFDFWYGDTLEDVDRAVVSFYPNAGEYRGNVYKDGRPIGDFITTDSVELGRIFPHIFD